MPIRTNRRTILGVVTGAAVASGLAVLDLFPWSKPKGAFADAYTTWGDCRGYFSASTICYPSSAYYTGNCSGPWHRNDGGSGTCYNYRYTHDPSSCDGHNAWRWTSGTRRSGPTATTNTPTAAVAGSPASPSAAPPSEVLRKTPSRLGIPAPGLTALALGGITEVALRAAGHDTHGFTWLVAALVAGFSLSGSV